MRVEGRRVWTVWYVPEKAARRTGSVTSGPRSPTNIE